MDSLRTLQIDEFKTKLKPAFDDIVKQLPTDKQSSINFDEIIVESYSRLQKMEVDIGVLEITFETHPDVKDSACVIAVIKVIWDVLSIAFKLAGLPTKVSDSIIGKIVQDINTTEMTVLEGLIEAFNDAGSNKDKAIFAVKFLKEIYDGIGAGAFLQAMLSSMSWVDWTIFGITALAQIVAWVGTDGAALVAELILLTAYLLTLTKDISTAQTACASNS